MSLTVTINKATSLRGEVTNQGDGDKKQKRRNVSCPYCRIVPYTLDDVAMPKQVTKCFEENSIEMTGIYWHDKDLVVKLKHTGAITWKAASIKVTTPNGVYDHFLQITDVKRDGRRGILTATFRDLAVQFHERGLPSAIDFEKFFEFDNYTNPRLKNPVWKEQFMWNLDKVEKLERFEVQVWDEVPKYGDRFIGHIVVKLKSEKRSTSMAQRDLIASPEFETFGKGKIDIRWSYKPKLPKPPPEEGKQPEVAAVIRRPSLKEGRPRGPVYHYQDSAVAADAMNRKFRKTFKPPQSETLLGHFHCALHSVQSDLLLQGMLFVSENFVYFDSEVFGLKTSLTLPLSDVVKAMPRGTMHRFSNSLQVVTTRGRHNFANFYARDKSLGLLKQVVQQHQAAHGGPPAMEIEVLDDSDGEEDTPDSESSDDDDEAGLTQPQEHMRSLMRWRDDSRETTLPQRTELDFHGLDKETVKMDKVLDAEFPMPSNDFFKFFFGDIAEFSQGDFQTLRGDSGVRMSKWAHNDMLGDARSLVVKAKLEGLPDYARQNAPSHTFVNRLERNRRSKEAFAVCCRIDTPEAPWGTHFQTYLKWEVVDKVRPSTQKASIVRQPAEIGCTARVYFGVQFDDEIREGDVRKREITLRLVEETRKVHEEWRQMALKKIDENRNEMVRAESNQKELERKQAQEDANKGTYAVWSMPNKRKTRTNQEIFESLPAAKEFYTRINNAEVAALILVKLNHDHEWDKLKFEGDTGDIVDLEDGMERMGMPIADKAVGTSCVRTGWKEKCSVM